MKLEKWGGTYFFGKGGGILRISKGQKKNQGKRTGRTVRKGEGEDGGEGYPPKKFVGKNRNPHSFLELPHIDIYRTFRT